MKNLMVIFGICLFSVQIANAQANGIQWQDCWGGGSEERAYSVNKTSDGGYIVGGCFTKVDGMGNPNGFAPGAIKYDNIGNGVPLNTIFSGSTGILLSIQQTSDGGYVGLVHNNCYNTIYKIGGGTQWQQYLPQSTTACITSVQQTADGGYVLSGTSTSQNTNVIFHGGYSDYWVSKLDVNGNMVWQKSFGGNNSDDVCPVQQTTDGGYIVAGRSSSTNGDVTGNHGGSDFWVVKLNTAGNLQWQKSLGGSGEEWANSVQQTSDGGYIVGGYSSLNSGDVTGNSGGRDFWVVKLNSNGLLQWERSVGGASDEQLSSIKQTSDGGYIMAGTTGTSSTDWFISKLNSNGSLHWQKVLASDSKGHANSILQTTDGGYVVVGDIIGNGVDVSGYQWGTDGTKSDWWVVKLIATVGIDEVDNETSILNIYPNPADEVLNIEWNYNIINNPKELREVLIVDIIGNLVLQTNINESQKNHINITNLSAGLYYVKIGNSAKKFIKR